MDSQTMVKTSMFDAAETPIHYISSSRDNSAFKDISFSSHFEPKGPSQNPPEKGNGCATDDPELSIFDAKKYFSESNNAKDLKTRRQQEPSLDMLSVPRLSSVSSVDGGGKNFQTRSEASWNSQNGLFVNPSRSVGPSDHRKKKSSAAKKWFLWRTCCCNRRKTVQVKEAETSDSKRRGPILGKCLFAKRDRSHKEKALQSGETHEHKSTAPNPLNPKIDSGSTEASRQQRMSVSGRPFLDRAVSFTFPILNPSSDQPNRPALTGTMAKPVINLPVYQQHELPAASPGPLATMDNCISSRGLFNQESPIAHDDDDDDDAGSDASSDLFEIESFSIQTTLCPTYRRKDAADEGPTNARRSASASEINCIDCERKEADCEVQSEVSIDWSVTSADGCDRDAAFLKRRGEESGGDGAKRKGNGLMLMGCRQEKAVSVGPEPVKCLAVDGASATMLKLHVGGRPPRADKPPVGSSQSPRLSLAFAA